MMNQADFFLSKAIFPLKSIVGKGSSRVLANKVCDCNIV